MALTEFETMIIQETHRTVQEMVVVVARIDERLNHLEIESVGRQKRRAASKAGVFAIATAAVGGLAKLVK